MKKSINKFQPVSTTDDAEFEIEQEVEILKVENEYASVASAPSKLSSPSTLRFMLLIALFCIFSLIVALFIVCFVLSSSQNAVTTVSSETLTGSAAHDYVIRDESCLLRHCCKPVYAGNEEQKQHCYALFLMDCVAESEFCEWRCSAPDDDDNHDSGNGLPRRRRKFYGISTGISPYVQETEFNTVANSTGASSVGEFIEMSTLISIDDCGVMYEERLDYDKAAEEFATLQQLRSDEAEHERRRMQLTASDIQLPIAQDGGGLVGSEQSVGCITYETGGGSWGGLYDTEYRYDHICTGTLLAPGLVLTSGHCCYPPSGSNFYSNWYYYPEIKNYQEIYEYQSYGYSGYGQYYKSYKVKRSYVYNAWKSYGNYDYDFCLMELWSGIYYDTSYSSYKYKYAKLDYNIEAYISSSQVHSYNVWNTLGYRYDKYSSTVNNGHLLYGWKQKYVQEISATYFSYSMDAYTGNDYYANGYAGAPIYYGGGSSTSSAYMKQYCVVSNRYNWKGSGYQYCTRITQTIYEEFYYICNQKYYSQYCNPHY